MKIIIDTPSAEDYPNWCVLYRQYAKFYEMPMDDAILQRLWSWIQDDKMAFYALVAKDDHGDLLGLMHFREMRSPLRAAMVGFLDDLYVSSESRGRGVVDDLFEALKDFAKQQGWPFVRWITAENNYRGRAVYDKLAEKTHWLTYQMPVESE